MKKIICVLLVCIFLSGCAAAQQKTQETLFAMDTVMDLQIWGADGKKAVLSVTSLIYDLEKDWSNQREDSVISALNRGESELTDAQKNFLEQAEALSERTGGAFDPKLHSVISLWGFLSGAYYVPDREELDAAMEQKLWNLGAAVKGYAGQLAAQLLQDMDVDRAILNLGGNIQTYGEKPDGDPWQIGIQDPDGGEYVGIVSVYGTASVVTSGDYQRYFEENGIRYHHILDPETGCPSDSGLRSVTVISRDGLTADALSTALFVMGLEAGIAHWRESNDFEAVFLLETGKIYATEGVALSGCEYEVIRREE